MSRLTGELVRGVVVSTITCERMKRACTDADDAAVAASLVRAKLMKKPSSIAPPPGINTAAVAAADAPAAMNSNNAASASSSAPAPTSHASLFARPKSFMKKPSSSITPAPAPASTVSDSSLRHRAALQEGASADDVHAAAIFGVAPRLLPPKMEESPTNGQQPLYQTLNVGSECLARIDGEWRRVTVVGTVHQGYENARFRVVPVVRDDVGAAAAIPRELPVAQLRAIPPRLPQAQTLCQFFLQGKCKKGDRCEWLHELGAGRGGAGGRDCG